MRTQTHLQTFRIWLEPDKDIPQFRRLCWEIKGVPIQDVLLHGIHPWMGGNGSGSDVHYSLPEAFLQRVNESEVKLPALEEFNYCGDVSVAYGYVWDKGSRFEKTLEAVRESLYFVDGLTYTGLLEIAKARLRETWTHTVAMELAKGASPGFQDLRQFIKRKDKNIKLSGYEDLDQYDLSRVLALEDFTRHDCLLISHGVPTLNFRKASFLRSVTDEAGRLQLVPDIKSVTLTETASSPDYAHVVWHVARKGSMLRFRPDIGESHAKRVHAREFAARWRTDDGRLCFQAPMDRLVEMVERKAVMPSFPSLNYNRSVDEGDSQEGPTASALVDASHIRAFHIGRYPNHKSTGDELKEVLRRYEVPMTGNKDQLLAKLSQLAGKKYREKLSELNAYFAEHRFVRVQSTPPSTGELPVLDGLVHLRNLVLTMYAIKHLRGNAILEATHENTTYTEDELALALLVGKVCLAGAFLRVA